MNRRRSGALLVLCSCVMLFSGCYLLKQAGYMLKYSARAVPVRKIVSNPATPDSLRQFLNLVSDIRRFAHDSIGLAKNKNYSTYVSIDKSYLVNVVCASGQLDFHPYTWCYPLFGCWPLRGYFDKEDAKTEAARLSRQGYDVYLGRVDAFSTLGILSDPVYSFMKDFSLYNIANLIIHEQTHATIYVKNQVDFNEELASFMGSEGALWFIRSKFGRSSPAYDEAVKLSRDNSTYYRCIRSLYDRLSTVYADSAAPPAVKLTKKREIIEGFKDSISRNYDSIFLTKEYCGLEKTTINNAFISVDMTYSMDLGLFYELYAQNEDDLHATFALILPLKKKSGNCKKNMRKLLLPTHKEDL
jgi:predicted aminopeptidase